MGVGMKRVRNWGKDNQAVALALVLDHKHVAFKVTNAKIHNGISVMKLWLAGSRNGVTLPFRESVAELVNVRRGRWHAIHPFDGRVLAKGISKTDVIRATIQAVWQ